MAESLNTLELQSAITSVVTELEKAVAILEIPKTHGEHVVSNDMVREILGSTLKTLEDALSQIYMAAYEDWGNLDGG